MKNAIILGRTGSAEYLLDGIRTFRRDHAGNTRRYLDFDDFVPDLLVGAMGPGWRETEQGKRLIDQFINSHPQT